MEHTPGLETSPPGGDNLELAGRRHSARRSLSVAFGEIDQARQPALACEAGRDVQEPLLTVERLLSLALFEARRRVWRPAADQRSATAAMLSVASSERERPEAGIAE